jgi:hypothetical protein
MHPLAVVPHRDVIQTKITALINTGHKKCSLLAAFNRSITSKFYVIILSSLT